MSSHVSRSSHDEEATSGRPLQAHGPGPEPKPEPKHTWMSHWMKRSPKPESMIINSSSICCKEEVVDRKSFLCGLKTEDVFSKSDKEVSNDSTERTSKMTKTPSPTLSLCRNIESTSTRGTQVGHKNISLALAVEKKGTSRDFNLLHETDLQSSEKEVLISRPVDVLERRSNDIYTRFDRDDCKYQKFSTFLFHEKNMNNDLSHELGKYDGLPMQHNPSMNNNFLPFFLKKQSKDIEKGKCYHGCQPLDRIPCSFHNVKTMRICTMIDSKISRKAHHFLFTKETCVNMLEEHCKEKTFGGTFSLSPDVGHGGCYPRGVKIQPLWSSTDSEDKENAGSHSTSKACSRNESSSETNAVQIDAPKTCHIHILPSVASSPFKKDNSVDENSPPAICDSSKEKTREKRPIVEIPDINEELPGLQPAISSTDSMEPSTSRVRNLDATPLLPCGEHDSRPESNARECRPLGSETSNRWIKRLKVTSSDSFGVGTKSSEMGETSHEKFNMFFNKITKCNKLSKNHGKEEMDFDRNMENIGSSLMGSRKRNESVMLGCSWIQRWSHHCKAPRPRSIEPLVICEPHSLKFGVDEAAKKQFPSIAAMALMGKAMNGFRPCEFRKRGPVVVWNTKEF